MAYAQHSSFKERPVTHAYCFQAENETPNPLIFKRSKLGRFVDFFGGLMQLAVSLICLCIQCCCVLSKQEIIHNSCGISIT